MAKVFHIEIFGSPYPKIYTFYIKQFFYRIPKVKLSVLEGYHTIEPNPYTNKTIFDASPEDTVFSITSRPSDMKLLAEQIIEICEIDE